MTDASAHVVRGRPQNLGALDGHRKQLTEPARANQLDPERKVVKGIGLRLAALHADLAGGGLTPAEFMARARTLTEEIDEAEQAGHIDEAEHVAAQDQLAVMYEHSGQPLGQDNLPMPTRSSSADATIGMGDLARYLSGV